MTNLEILKANHNKWVDVELHDGFMYTGRVHSTRMGFLELSTGGTFFPTLDIEKDVKSVRPITNEKRHAL